MKSSLKIASLIIIFFIGAHLIIPKIADAAGKSSNLTASGSSTTASKSLTTDNPVDSQVWAESNSDYEPPNYGSPDSYHGSGTR